MRIDWRQLMRRIQLLPGAPALPLADANSGFATLTIEPYPPDTIRP
jgi:hypothetical protein